MDESTRPSLPGPDSVSPVPESVADESDESDTEEGSSLPAEHRDAVRRLRRRVEQAIDTIEALRAENERLRRRVEELEAKPAFPEAETVLTLDDDPDAVKDRISRFIDTIDTYLEAAEPDAPSGEDTDAGDA